MGHGGSISRIKSSRNILQQSFESRFGRLNILDTSKVLSLTNGFIGLPLRQHKLLRHRAHEQHEIGFLGGYQPMGKQMIIVSNASWQFVVLWMVPDNAKTLAPFKTH